MFFLGFAPLLKPRLGLQHDSPPTHLQCFLPNIFWWEFHRTLSCEPLPFYQLCQMNKSLVEVASTRQPGLLLSSVWQGVKHIASSWQIINAKPASGSLCWLLLLRAEVTHAQFPGVTIARSSPALQTGCPSWSIVPVYGLKVYQKHLCLYYGFQ